MGGVLTGAGTRVNIQWESDFRSAESNPSPFVPGAGGTLDTAEAVNNITRITNFSKDVAAAMKAGAFEGAWSLSWDLTTPWWLRSIFGTPNTTDNGDGSHTHAYSLSSGDPDSFQILEGYETSTTAERALKGCVTGSARIEPSVDDDGGSRVTMEGFYAIEDTSTGVSLTSQDTIDEEVLNYADATLKRDGTAEALVQNATLDLSWEASRAIQTFGSRFATEYLVGLFSPTLDYSKLKTDAAALQDVYGGASATVVQEDIENSVSAELSLDNGKAAGSGINQHVYSLSGTYPESYGEDGIGQPTEAITENLSRPTTNVTVNVTNETATPP
ncbi:hypothetical protein [Haloarcula pellucida]|uniref:Uncharacterized protein n=1 Tax=Haloarcula pellucida TaxID=1427151 RepID=A0A830GQ97_9EURY|nr:hypothetical protein [Halomicroarcula pellucida]MBX0350471.1 hypothetical protein [Halomicroarcula pellucida]GGO03488.1 hypothetical protein GCM10009030_39170 [Halomicroarcula pellucida]